MIRVGVRLAPSKHQEEPVEIWKGTEHSKHVLPLTRLEAEQVLFELVEILFP